MWFGQAMLLLLINATLLFGVTGYALRYGGSSERFCAGILVVGSLASALIVSAFHNLWHPASFYLFFIDCSALLALLAIALTSDRFWPLYTAAFQVPGVATHIATMVDPVIVPRAYALAQGFWIYPMLVALLIGTSGFRKRAREANRIR